jgi:hypothetical protein
MRLSEGGLSLRLSKRLVGRPSACETFSCFCVPNAEQARPLGKRLRFSTKRNPTGHAFIEGLLPASSPPAILRAVRAVVVNPVKRHAKWARPHVRQKGAEVSPARAIADASPAIVQEVRAAGVIAALFHACPDRELSRAGEPVPTIRVARALALQTPARQRVAGSQVGSAGDYLGPALASTPPSRVAVGGHSFASKHAKFARHEARKI